MPAHITRYDTMPIPPVPEQTEYLTAGPVTFGIEYRLLSAAIGAANVLQKAVGGDKGSATNDRGVSVHVFAREEGDPQECLRFDCFNEDPHYHYISWKGRSNEMLHLDPHADGDSLAWALERIRTRLPQMLERAGARKTAAAVDMAEIEALMPRLAEAAFRARFQHDEEAVLSDALKV